MRQPAVSANTQSLRAASRGCPTAVGFVSLSLNPKGRSMLLVMFSQFLSPGLPLAAQVRCPWCSLWRGLACHCGSIYGGQVLFGRSQSPRAIRLQGLAFGVCMLVVAGVMAVS